MNDSEKDTEVSNAASMMGKKKRWADMSEEERKAAMERLAPRDNGK
jgi:hypothetical protein